MPESISSTRQTESVSWHDVYAEKQDLALTSPTPKLRAHFAEEVRVMAPTIAAMNGGYKVPPALTAVGAKAPVAVQPAPIDWGSAAVPSDVHPVPVAVDDSNGHTSGHIVATNPSKYDQLINEACDYYGRTYGVKLDPNVIKAHIWQESKGDPLALSRDGQNSRGLMQVSNSTGVPTAAIIAKIKLPDGSVDANIPIGGGDQYDPRTSIFTGVKYEALAISGQVTKSLEASGIPGSELGTFPDRRLTQVEALRAYQGGPGVLRSSTPASEIYGKQLEGLSSQFAAGKAPSDPGYTNPAGGPGWIEPSYGAVV
jgi:hypothetical protein